MVTKIWKYKKVNKYRDLWTKRNDKYGDFILVDKTLGVITKDKYVVAARRKINLETINGHYRFYKNKASAIKYVKAYIEKY